MLVGICGNLGAGKTLTLTFFGWYLHTKMGASIYSNYWLQFPHKIIKDLTEIDNIKGGVFLGDELWSWMDSRTFGSNKNMAISKILLKSRKRGIDIFYTAQHFKQMDVRVRRITDMLCFPEMNARGGCTVHFYNYFMERTRKPITFDARFFFDKYDTEEEVGDIKGFEAEKALRKIKEVKALKLAKKMGIKLDDDENESGHKDDFDDGTLDEDEKDSDESSKEDDESSG
jgi:hypothetical protein